MKITAQIQGGLGNQLFQYATGKALSIRLKGQLLVDIDWFNHYWIDVTPREFLLPFLNIQLQMIQVSPRALVEYGGLQPDALASWLTWRKWFYDLDNRAAQETGYLFEPILAAALGGEAKGAKNSPIKRTDDASKGRQVDCWRIVTTSKGIRKRSL